MHVAKRRPIHGLSREALPKIHFLWTSVRLTLHKGRVSTGTIDLRFITLLCSGMASLLSIIFVEQLRSQRDDIKGLGWWAAAPIIMLAGSLMLAARGLIPLWFSVVLSNVLIVSGVFAFYTGLRRFYYLDIEGWTPALIVLIGIAAYYYSYVDPDYRVRVAVFAAAMFCFQLAQALVLVRHGQKSFSSRFLLASNILMMAVLVLRITTVFDEAKDGQLFTPSFIQNIYLATYGGVLVAQSVGFMLLYHDRLRFEIEDLANHDFLTGLWSRGWAFKRGLALMQDAIARHEPMSVLMFDLDHFKTVNDTLGHLNGDTVLQSFATLGRQHFRDTHLFSRFGGEEFMAILPATSAHDAMAMADEVRALQAQSHLPHVTVSVGVATLIPSATGEDPMKYFEQLLSAADKALYAAKQAGRNRCVHASELDAVRH